MSCVRFSFELFQSLSSQLVRASLDYSQAVEMKVENRRLFVGNLPPSSTEETLAKKFQKYGNVLSMELKKRADGSIFAFLDLEIHPTDLESCLKRVSRKSWDGHEMKVELAKESFLTRLGRERELSKSGIVSPKKEQQLQSGEDETIQKGKSGINVRKKSRKSTEEVIGEEDYKRENIPIFRETLIKPSIQSDEEDHTSITTPAESQIEKNLLQKFESFSDVWKDDPSEDMHVNNYRSQEFDSKSRKADNVHKDRKSLSEFNVPTKKIEEIDQHQRNQLAEERRLRSIAERRKSVLLQKQTVKTALMKIDSTARNGKKIIYDEDYIGNNNSNCYLEEDKTKIKSFEDSEETNAKKGKLFSDDESEDEANDFKIKSQFEGLKGQKLLALQARYANDKRFTLDKRFYESDDEPEDVPGSKSTEEVDEKKKQLQILQNILGQELHVPEESKLKQKRKSMLRFDPTKPDHVKYEVKKPEGIDCELDNNTLAEKIAAKRRNKEKTESAGNSEPVPKVSNDKYYEVSDTLKDAFKKSEGFSLLNIFGSNDSGDKDGEYQDNVLSKDSKKKKQIGWSLNPFKYDSSESEDEQEQKAPPVERKAFEHKETWHETFFFTPNDVRLKEGLKFLAQKDEIDNFAAKRRELKQIVRYKIKNNQKKKLTWKKKLGGKKHNKIHEKRKPKFKTKV